MRQPKSKDAGKFCAAGSLGNFKCLPLKTVVSPPKPRQSTRIPFLRAKEVADLPRNQMH